MKSLSFLVISILTVALIASGEKAFAENGGFCRSINSSNDTNPSTHMCM
jgi:hypothetical protein